MTVHDRRLTVVSGGQSGVDRAALDAALALGLPCGGWCPAGRRAEDGVIPDRYPLRPTPSARPEQRTEWNVRDADATLIISPSPLSGGTALAQRWAARYGRPCRVVDPDGPLPEDLLDWLRAAEVRVLNVAGPRERERPGIHERARALLMRILG